ncbi:MAG: hypothetical protein ACX93I_10890 [Winogradskyella sp.]
METKFIMVVDLTKTTHHISVNHIVYISDYGGERVIYLTDGTGIKTLLTREHIAELIKS